MMTLLLFLIMASSGPLDYYEVYSFEQVFRKPKAGDAVSWMSWFLLVG